LQLLVQPHDNLWVSSPTQFAFLISLADNVRERYATAFKLHTLISLNISKTPPYGVPLITCRVRVDPPSLSVIDLLMNMAQKPRSDIASADHVDEV